MVAAIKERRPLDVKNAFDKAIRETVATKINEKRTKIAKTIFKPDGQKTTSDDSL